MFGSNWEYLEVCNVESLREVVTYRKMFPMVASTDPNDVTFCLHGKGAQPHVAESEPVSWWIDAMYETVVFNMKEVTRSMEEGASVVGSFRRHGRMLGTLYHWHFSGAFFAIRNARAFRDGVPALRSRWFGLESWPGEHFPLSHSACLFADHVGSLYRIEQQPRAELVQWQQHRERQGNRERTAVLP